MFQYMITNVGRGRFVGLHSAQSREQAPRHRRRRRRQQAADTMAVLEVPLYHGSLGNACLTKDSRLAVAIFQYMIMNAGRGRVVGLHTAQSRDRAPRHRRRDRRH